MNDALQKDNIAVDKDNETSDEVWDCIHQALKEEIEEGRTLFTSRVSKQISASGMYDSATREILPKSRSTGRKGT